MKGAQISPEQSDLATSSNVQAIQADKPVGESTVSLDELSVQPDFPYDNSEQSDDDPGSDSSIQTVLTTGK